MEKTERIEDFNERRRFDDRSADDGRPGPARAVDVSGRCADCWGPIAGTKEPSGEWQCIECLVCGRAVDGKDAAREAEAMWQEADDNMAAARVGRGASYRDDAHFVLKLLPDMDRDMTKVDRRNEVSLEEGRKRGRLTRHEMPPGTAGYLYAQARALLAQVYQRFHELACNQRVAGGREPLWHYKATKCRSGFGDSGNGSGQTTVRRVPPGLGSMPSAS